MNVLHRDRGEEREDEAHPEEELPLLVAGFDPEGVVHVGEDAGCLNLEDVRRHRALRGDAHVLVDDRRRKSSARAQRLTAAATEDTVRDRLTKCTGTYNKTLTP